MTKQQHIAIFTTASLPWMTGTAVNPLFRAAYLTNLGSWRVSLVIPWLSLRDQELVYPDKITFTSPSDHASYVQDWLDERIGPTKLNIRFYPGKFSVDKRSILAIGDITEIIPDDEADVAVLEEPEHLTWYHHGQRWKTKFQLVVGVVHTNYLEYVRREKNGVIQAFFLKYANSWVVQIYCHKVIRLSAATQYFPRSVICNVHGVNPKFLEIGRKMQEQQQQLGNKVFSKGAYYIGKMVWSKGYRELLQLLSKDQHELEELDIDLYGNGEDFTQIKEAAEKLKLNIRVYPGCDHADSLFQAYKVFINPSTSDVVCTTTAEALAMGKIVVCANHPSNDFFKQFPNCRTYKDPSGFVTQTLKALVDEPFQLSDSHRYELSWEAATERFLEASELKQPCTRRQEDSTPHTFMSISLQVPNWRRKIEDAAAYLHYRASGFEAARRAFGAIPCSLQLDDEQRQELGLQLSGAGDS